MRALPTPFKSTPFQSTPFQSTPFKSTLRTTLVPLAVVATLSLAACGGTDTANERADALTSEASASSADHLTVSDPWVRATTGSKDPSMTGAFMAIDNGGEDPVVVVNATSPLTKAVQLHEMVMVDGTSVMQEVDGGIEIAAGRGQLLQPGGMHVMLMGLTGELAAGDEVELTLVLDDGSTLDVTAPVKEFTEETEHYHAPGTDDEHSH